MVGDSELSSIGPKLLDYSNLVTRMPQFAIPKNPVVEQYKANLASQFYKQLVEWINKFDLALDDEHEVGVRLVSFGQSVVFHLDSLGYSNPSLISFSGTLEDGSPVELVQHVSQISVLLMKLPRPDTSKPKQPIGFCPPLVREAEPSD